MNNKPNTANLQFPDIPILRKRNDKIEAQNFSKMIKSKEWKVFACFDSKEECEEVFQEYKNKGYVITD